MATTIDKPIIGTHNSMTFLRPAKWYGWFMIPFARCQSDGLKEQWYAGARVFDLRIYFDNQSEEWEFAHGLMNLQKEETFSKLVRRLSNTALEAKEDVYIRIILEKWELLSQCNYFAETCKALENLYENNPYIHFFGGNRKGDWKKLYTFKGDTPDSLNNQWVSSMAEDARWYEKFLPFAYARRCNKKNKENVKPKFNLFDFI